MFLGRVVGDVVATVKHAALADKKLLVVLPVAPDDRPVGKPVIAVDAADAGPGDLVLVEDEGNMAAQVLRQPRGPIRTVIVGIVDEATEPSGVAPAGRGRRGGAEKVAPGRAR
jgi:microcompartment protein CcmK/EutM